MNTAGNSYPRDVKDSEGEFLLPSLTLTRQDAPLWEYALRDVSKSLRSPQRKIRNAALIRQRVAKVRTLLMQIVWQRTVNEIQSRGIGLTDDFATNTKPKLPLPPTPQQNARR